MSKRTLLPITFMLLTVAWVRTHRHLGDLSRADSQLVRRTSSGQFDSATWRFGDGVARGAALADLLNRNRFVGQSAARVTAMLGRGECYVAYDDEPCYLIVLGARRYDLQFHVNHSDQIGQVVKVALLPR